MTELRDDLQEFNPSRVLDFGSGSGTAALAVWDVWGAEGGHEEVNGGEQQRHEGNVQGRYMFHRPWRPKGDVIIRGALNRDMTKIRSFVY